jgi:hypothetical protein
MSAHWYWDWDWQRDDRHLPEATDDEQKKRDELTRDPRGTVPVTQPAPPPDGQHHLPHVTKDRVPLNKVDGNKPCTKHIVYFGRVKPEEADKPDDRYDWRPFRLREVNHMGQPIDPYGHDEWYWVACQRRSSECCPDGCEFYEFLVLLPTPAHGEPVYIQDFKCRCKYKGER